MRLKIKSKKEKKNEKKIFGLSQSVSPYLLQITGALQLRWYAYANEIVHGDAFMAIGCENQYHKHFSFKQIIREFIQE